MKGKTIKLGFSGEHIKFLKQNGVVFFFVALLMAGYFGGIIFSSNEGGITHRISEIFFENFIEIRLNGNFINVLMSSFVVSFAFLFVNFISGLSLVGVFFVSFTLYIKGMLFGMIAGFSVASYSFKGLLFYICIIVPSALISSVSLIFSSRRSTEFSRKLLIGLSSAKSVSVSDLKFYCLRNLIFLGFTFLSAVADSLLSKFFGRLFGL